MSSETHGGSRRRIRDEVMREPVRTILLTCGIASSLLYGVMIWLIRYDGYSPLSQTVSELSSWGVSTRSLWIVLGALYELLMLAFAVGVWASAAQNRSLRFAGGLLIGYSLLGLAWPFASMHQRAVLAAGGATLADNAHLVLAMTTVILMFAAMAFGAAAIRGWFRVYSIVTIAALLLFGVLTTSTAPRVQEDLPTPWTGLWERINIGVFLIWVVVLAIVLLRTRSDRHPLMSINPRARRRKVRA